MRRAVLKRAILSSVESAPQSNNEKNSELILSDYQNKDRQVSSAAQPVTHDLQLELKRTLRGHGGWIWDVQVDVENDWFATASADGSIRVWSLASGSLKTTFTNHKLAVRALAISPQMPYMFSGGEDVQLLCWDLETNKPIRSYHGHRSGVYTVALHPEIPYLLASGSRDSSIRLWDVRSRACIRVLNHEGPVNKIVMQCDEPQLISGSQDRTVQLWDIASGTSMNTLTQHQNSVRALAVHPTEYTFVSAARDGIRQWKMPNGEELGNFGAYHNDGILSAACDARDNLFVGYESGLKVYNYTTGELIESVPTPSSVLSCTIDRSGTRLITGHTDNEVRVWRIS